MTHPRDPERPRAAVRLAELEELELSIEKLVAGGDGLGRFEGIPIFVPRSAPGDRLEVRLVERRPDYGRAEIVRIIEPGPGRREAPCPHFDRCGGCDLQHLEDDVQVRLKSEAVVETLQRIADLHDLPVPKIIVGAPFGYRLRSRLHVRRPEAGVEVGYFERGSNDLVAIDSCPVLVPELERLLPSLPKLLSETGAKRVDLAAGDVGSITVAPALEGMPRGEVELRVGESIYRYDAQSFFQAHRELVAPLIEQAVGEAEGETAVDLYAGVGLFAIPLAARYENVLAVESDRVAARYARRNARANHLTNVWVETMVVESWLPRLPKNVDRVVVDPPRAGLPPSVVHGLLAGLPRHLTYVSCHAATLARDVGRLSGAYRMTSMTLLDMFPQTGHMEVVAQLEVR